MLWTSVSGAAQTHPRQTHPRRAQDRRSRARSRLASSAASCDPSGAPAPNEAAAEAKEQVERLFPAAHLCVSFLSAGRLGSGRGTVVDALPGGVGVGMFEDVQRVRALLDRHLE